MIKERVGNYLLFPWGHRKKSTRFPCRISTVDILKGASFCNLLSVECDERIIVLYDILLGHLSHLS